VPLRRVRLRCAWLSASNRDAEVSNRRFAPQRPIKPEQTRTVHASTARGSIPGSEFQLSFLRSAATMPLQMSLGAAVELVSPIALESWCARRDFAGAIRN